MWNDLVSLFQSLSPIDWLWILAAVILGTVPLFPQIKHFRQTGSIDYLILGGIFLVNASCELVYVLFDRHTYILSDKFVMISFYVGIFLIFVHAIRLRWETKPKVIWYGTLIWCSVMIIIALLLPETSPSSEQIIGGFYRLWVGFVLFFAYTTVKPVIASKRINNIRKGVAVIALLIIIHGLVESVGRLIVGSEEPFQLLLAILTVIYSVFLFYHAIRYPELMLISHSQILRALKLYQELATTPMEKYKADHLVNYLKSIPADIFGES